MLGKENNRHLGHTLGSTHLIAPWSPPPHLPLQKQSRWALLSFELAEFASLQKSILSLPQHIWSGHLWLRNQVTKPAACSGAPRTACKNTSFELGRHTLAQRLAPLSHSPRWLPAWSLWASEQQALPG